MSMFGNLLRETLREIKPPIVRFVLIASIMCMMWLAGENYWLKNKDNDRIDAHDEDNRKRLEIQDSTIDRLRRDKNYLTDRIYIIQQSYNEERIKFISETIDKVNKVTKQKK